MAVSDSETWRDRIAGLAIMGFACWNIASGELLPFQSTRRIEGLWARVIGGILLLIGLVMLLRTISRRDHEV